MFSRLIVKFKNDKFAAANLVDSLETVDFFTKIGGICNLFVGASLISFIELVYYFTIRLFFANRSNWWSHHLNRCMNTVWSIYALRFEFILCHQSGNFSFEGEKKWFFAIAYYHFMKRNERNANFIYFLIILFIHQKC